MSPKIDRKTAAKQLKVSIRTVDRYIKSGKLKTEKDNGRIWLYKKEIGRIQSRHKVDNVDNGMSIDKVDSSATKNVHSLSTPKTQKTAKESKKSDNDVYKKLYEELHEEAKINRKRLEAANYRVGQLEAMVKESIPILDHQKLLADQTTARLNAETEMETALNTLENAKKTIKEMKISKRIYFYALFIFLLLQPLWLILLQNR
ncbi:hypothetical protein GF340_02820 [Candidatus Peregrinibacteria bacterium]|nr:hypothetical protein [Candidatus Peregrinibacteria bacterium]